MGESARKAGLDAEEARLRGELQTREQRAKRVGH